MILPGRKDSVQDNKFIKVEFHSRKIDFCISYIKSELRTLNTENYMVKVGSLPGALWKSFWEKEEAKRY